MSDSIVIIPTYNEKENIAKIIDAVFALPKGFHILIVDDGSPDGTADIVRDLMNLHPKKLHLVEREGKLGLGTAYIFGFEWCLERDYEYIFEMDADFSHPPASLIDLYEACTPENVGMTVGSRYVKGGKVENWPLKRVLLSYFASVYVRIITWLPVRDTTAGFVCYHRSVLETIDLNKIQFIGYAFQIEMKYATWKLGFKIVEVPITFIDRVEGVSKMSMNIFKEAVYGVIVMRLTSIFRSYSKIKISRRSKMKVWLMQFLG